MNLDAATPQSTRPPRTDLFVTVHKGLRLALAETLAALGSTDFGDAASASKVIAELRLVLAFCEEHKHVEDTIVFPTLQTRSFGLASSLTDAHASQARLLAELEATCAALLVAPATERPLIGRTLYLHFSTFVADNLAHMAEEEQLLSPLFERLFREDEVRAIYARVLDSLDKEQQAKTTPFIVRAVNRNERAAMISGALASMPRAVVLGLLESIGPKLVPSDLEDLLARTGLAT